MKIKLKKILAAVCSALLGVSAMSIPVLAAGSGDCDLDGDLSINDAFCMQDYLLGRNKLSSKQFSEADMNGDRKVNVFDLAILKRRLAERLGGITAEELSRKLEAYAVETKEPGDAFAESQTELGISLFKSVLKEDGNTLVSPYSVTAALAMAANGAGGKTKREMEKVIGGGMIMDELNKQLSAYIKGQPDEEKCRLLTANSIWAKKGEFITDKDFLRKNKSYYGSEFYSAPFDSSTVRDVNLWTKKNTGDMIPKLIDDIDPDAVMMLINAVTFDAKWASPFEYSYDDKKGFTAFDGTKQDVKRMSEGSAGRYIKDTDAEGFIKDYCGGRYSFAVIQPDRGVSVTDYAKGLTGEKFRSLIDNAENTRVTVTMPKFSSEFDVSLVDSLKKMGMTTAFDDRADFTKLGKTVTGEPVCISDVIHKTKIDVDAEGTKAAAATAEIMVKCTAVMKQIYVDITRPFIYAIIDNDTNIPIFIGTLLKMDN